MTVIQILMSMKGRRTGTKIKILTNLLVMSPILEATTVSKKT